MGASRHVNHPDKLANYFILNFLDLFAFGSFYAGAEFAYGVSLAIKLTQFTWNALMVLPMSQRFTSKNFLLSNKRQTWRAATLSPINPSHGTTCLALGIQIIGVDSALMAPLILLALVW
jgi:hypothetical protein